VRGRWLTAWAMAWPQHWLISWKWNMIFLHETLHPFFVLHICNWLTIFDLENHTFRLYNNPLNTFSWERESLTESPTCHKFFIHVRLSAYCSVPVSFCCAV
jgi:hypothetical protein